MLLGMQSVSLCGRPNIDHGKYHVLTRHPVGHASFRNHIPWAVITTTNFCSALALLLLRYLLATDNARRERQESYVQYELDGTTIEIDRAFLDLTDRQNHEFRYVY